MLFGIFKNKRFTPNFNLSEYDNWLEFVASGGNGKKWEQLKTAYGWKFKESDTEKFERYQKEVKPSQDRYFYLLQKIQKDWSVLYKSGDYTCEMSDIVERDCVECIACYKVMRKIDKKHGEKTPENAPAFKRLAMLYERRGNYEASIRVCVDALNVGAWSDGMAYRLERMIKKSGREPTDKEKNLIEKYKMKEQLEIEKVRK